MNNILANQSLTRLPADSYRRLNVLSNKSPITDTAVVLFLKGDLQLPEVPIALTPVTDPIDIGADVGWLGYPAIEPNVLCFFSGKVSAADTGRYLIDGVAINGVSGGPVFHKYHSDIQIMGCVSAYQPNLATGVSMPGLSYAQDVSHFHDVATRVQSIDDAKRKKQEFDRQYHRGLSALGDTGPLPSAGTAPIFSNGPNTD